MYAVVNVDRHRRAKCNEAARGSASELEARPSRSQARIDESQRTTHHGPGHSVHELGGNPSSGFAVAHETTKTGLDLSRLIGCKAHRLGECEGFLLIVGWDVGLERGGPMTTWILWICQ